MENSKMGPKNLRQIIWDALNEIDPSKLEFIWDEADVRGEYIRLKIEGRVFHIRIEIEEEQK